MCGIIYTLDDEPEVKAFGSRVQISGIEVELVAWDLGSMSSLTVDLGSHHKQSHLGTAIVDIPWLLALRLSVGELRLAVAANEAPRWPSRKMMDNSSQVPKQPSIPS